MFGWVFLPGWVHVRDAISMSSGNIWGFVWAGHPYLRWFMFARVLLYVGVNLTISIAMSSWEIWSIAWTQLI